MRRAPTSLVALAVTTVLAATLLVLPWSAPASAAPADVPLDAPVLRRQATGYWMMAGDGGVFSFGDAPFHGSTGNLQLAAPVVSAAATPSGGGYWMVARDGGVFAFGDAGFFGSTGGTRLNQPIVGMAATPSGKGYWLVARDGGVFAFGDAGFFGSTGAIALNQPVVGMAATPSGKGYWLVARDGGIFAFGDAAFHGSTGDRKLNAPIVAMAPSVGGNGYWLVATDGGIFTFGDAAFHGSTGGTKLNKPIVNLAVTGFGGGYWLVASDGGVFAFGDAAFHGSTGNLQLASPVVAMAVHPRSLSGGRSAIFYYPWYGTEDVDGEWRHWEDPNPDDEPGPFTPPDDIAANFYPARGLYSSRDTAVLNAQMAEIKAMGVSTVVVSWWGPASAEDAALPGVVAAARAHGLTPAVHVEPYAGRTVDHASVNIGRLIAQRGITEFWIYVSDGPPAEAWRVVTDTYPAARFWAHSHRAANATSSLFASYAATAGFDGVYTYDSLPYSPESFSRVCAQARARGLLCSPSVNPGYDDRRIRPSSGSTVRDRLGGGRYDAYWRGAFSAGADVVSITSYNEWHEGTQIEAATPRCTLTAGSCYSTYAGAYGVVDAAAAAGAYVERTRLWVAALKAAAATQ